MVRSITDEKIPEGKLISKTHGDPRALEAALEKLKKFGFTGYVLTRMSREGHVSEGYLILKDGNITAAIYGRRTDGAFIVTKKGEEALKLAWGDSYDRMSDLEVHGRVDIDIILQNFPLSQIKTLAKKKTLKRRTRFSLEWGNNEKAGPPEDVDGIPEELKESVEKWRSEGYVVKNLVEDLKENPGNATVAFGQFESNIRRAEFLEEELDSLDCKQFSNDVERLRALIKNPYKITAIEAAVQGLKLKVEQEKLREKEEKLARLMSQAESARAPEPRASPAPEYEARPIVPAQDQEDAEESLAGHGDIMPPTRPEGGRCTVCGAELEGRTRCPACGADGTQPGRGLTPRGDSNLIPEYDFDSFILGDSNRFSHSAALAVSKPDTSSYNPLYIYGGSGLGKSHLLNAIGNSVAKNYPKKKVLYITGEGFVNEYAEASKNNRKRQFKKKFNDLDFFLMDDINLIADNEDAQNELCNILNALFKAERQIVITGDRAIRDLADINERLISLLEIGLATEMLPPDFKTRLSILKMKAAAQNINMKDDMLQYVAQRTMKNVRMLEGALKTLVAYSELMKVPLTLETAKLALKDEGPETAGPKEGGPEDAMPFEKAAEKLKISHSYLVEENRPVKCFEYFVDNLNLGIRGMALTRVNPKRLREQFDLGGASILWLTDREGDADTRVVPVLEKIIYRIEDFLNAPGKSILLLDGLDYLISNNNFDSVLKFLRRLIDEVSESDAILITSVTPETLDQQALNILEREMEILTYL